MGRAFHWLPSGVLLIVLLGLSGDVAEAAKRKKPPAAKAQLQKAFRKLMRTKNYTVDTKVLGGLAKNEEHKVVDVTVNESYGGTVFGPAKNPIMHIPSIKAFKRSKAGHGVIDRDGLWARILTTDEGVKMDRLVDFPVLILAEAMRYSKTARWLEDDEIPESFRRKQDKAKAEKKKKKKKKSSKKKRGKTSVKKKTKKRSIDPDFPRVVRVTAAPQQALDIWIKRVENSGCMRDG